MKFDVKNKKKLVQLVQGFGLIYESKGPQDKGITYEEIVSRDPLRVGIISSIHNNFTRGVCDVYLGIFPQSRPEENKDSFQSWLQETYQKIPDAAKYLFV